MKLNLTTKSVGLSRPLAGVLGGKYATYLLPVISALIVLILLLFVVKPRFLDIFKLRNNIAQAKQDVVVLESKLTTLKGFNQDKLLSDVKKVEVSLPSDKDLPGLLLTLERIAAETGVSIAAVQLTPGQISPTPAGGEVENFPVKATITGNFFQVKNYLVSVFGSPRMVAVKSVTITSGTAGAVASLSATLNLDSFFQQLAATKVVVRDPLQNLTSTELQILEKIAVPAPVAGVPPPPPVTGKADPFAPF